MSNRRERLSEKSEMSSVEFIQHALQTHVAPPSKGSVKARLRYAARRLGWAYSRVRDAWYADPRIRISADELREVEQLTGLTYGRRELNEFDALISRANALLEGEAADISRPLAAAIRAFLGALAGTGIEG